MADTRPFPSNPVITVVFVDSHRSTAARISAALDEQYDIEVAAVAPSIAAAAHLVGEIHPEVVVIDHQLSDGDGAEGARRLRQIDPSVNVVMLAATGSETVFVEALAAGCTGIVTRDASVDDLSTAIRAARTGGAPAGSPARPPMKRVAGESGPLTARELEVLQALGQGLSTPAIARSLRLSEHTVRNHIRNILNKLHSHTKLEAVMTAARVGLLDVEGSHSERSSRRAPA